MTEPVRPLEALIAKWRLDAEDGLEDSDTLIECADELAALLQAAAPPAPTAEQKCWIVTDYEGGGIRGVFQAQSDAEAEIAAICADHEDLTRRDFIIGTYRVRPAALPERVSEGKGSLADWIVREARAISGPRTHLQDVEALIQFGIRVAQYVTRPAVEPREEPR